MITTSPDFPSTTTAYTGRTCGWKINKCQLDICQVPAKTKHQHQQDKAWYKPSFNRLDSTLWKVWFHPQMEMVDVPPTIFRFSLCKRILRPQSFQQFRIKIYQCRVAQPPAITVPFSVVSNFTKPVICQFLDTTALQKYTKKCVNLR